MPCLLPPIVSIDACSPFEHKFQFTPALSVKQPFASLIVYGMKPLEIRSRQTHIRGRVVICSSKLPYDGIMLHPEQPGRFLHSAQYVSELGDLAIYGQALGMVDIVGCRPMNPDDCAKALVSYRPGLYAWELANAVEIDPFPVIGQLGFFKVPTNQIRVKSRLWR